MTCSRGSRALPLRGGLAFGLLLAMAASDAAAQNQTSMMTGELTSQPIGHYEFCKANPAECSIRVRDAGPLPLNSALWKEIVDVNRAVNASIKPMNDYDLYGKDEVWAFPRAAGDCEDYVLEKRRELTRKGISLADLLITVVRKPDGEGHAVLTVRTNEGDFILDNLNDTVKPWDTTGYRYLKRQSTTHTGRWVSIREDNTTLVGSVN
jgi:predicted transglutaminase-like cysteine proteinase